MCSICAVVSMTWVESSFLCPGDKEKYLVFPAGAYQFISIGKVPRSGLGESGPMLLEDKALEKAACRHLRVNVAVTDDVPAAVMKSEM